MMSKAYLEITLTIDEGSRPDAASVYQRFKTPFLETVKGAVSKELLIRSDDVQVLHGFDTKEDAEGYLASELFNRHVVVALKPYLAGSPEVKLYTVA